MVTKEEKYYFGGYYLTRLRPKNSGNVRDAIIYTCSECINDNLVSGWSYSCADKKDVKEAKKKYLLSRTSVGSIQNWVDRAFDEGRLGWVNVFTELEAALEYRRKFFGHLPDTIVMALYFDEVERAAIIDQFTPETANHVEIGLRMALMKGITETDNELPLGFDYIAVEVSGNFHTFHCQNIETDLATQFNLSLNKYGLFDSPVNSREVLDYLNDENNGFESIPWFIAKVKLVATDGLPTEGWQKISADSRAFEFLNNDEELYSLKDVKA